MGQERVLVPDDKLLVPSGWKGEPLARTLRETSYLNTLPYIGPTCTVLAFLSRSNIR